MNPIGEVRKLLEERACNFEDKLDRIIELLEEQANASHPAVNVAAVRSDAHEEPST